MPVPSFLFLAAAAFAALLHGLFRARAWRMGVLLVVNLCFLLSFSQDPLQWAPYIAFLLIGFALIKMVGAGVSGWAYAAAITVILAGFFWLKRYSFIPEGLFLPFAYATVGLSYVFFRVMHLAIAARDEPEAARVGPIQYLNYTLNFTALTSGPVQGYEDYKRMTEEEPASLTLGDAGVALERIMTGLFKFTVMATLVSLAQRSITADLGAADVGLVERALLTALLTAAYPVFLFFNFSGYTSFVIGVARFFRLELPENFNQPFRATSFIDYWNRWHMSLSNWLKTHVYNPLLLTSARWFGRSDLLPYLGALALFVTFFLIGVWHGRTWHFFFFGVLNGGGVAANQFYRIWMQKRLGTAGFAKLGANPFYEFFTRGLTFAWVGFTLLWFWSDWPQLGGFAKGLGGGGLALAAVMLVAGGCVALGLLQSIGRLALSVTVGGEPLIASRYVRTVWMTVMLLAVIAVKIAMAGDTGDVVYKEF